MDRYDEMDEEQDLKLFSGVFGLSQFLGLLAIVLVGIWMGTFQGGFAWQGKPEIQFNYHPLFMIMGMVFIYGDAILVYRLLRNERKKLVKLIHMSLQLVALVLAGVALKAVFDSHNYASTPIPNLYSLHSWVGLITIILFCFQFLCGFITYLFPQLSLGIRQSYMPVHIFFGIGIYVLVIGTCLLGITEKALFSIKKNVTAGQQGYSELPAEGILVNVLGLVILLFAFSLIYLVVNPNYKRQPLPEEEIIHLSLE